MPSFLYICSLWKYAEEGKLLWEVHSAISIFRSTLFTLVHTLEQKQFITHSKNTQHACSKTLNTTDYFYILNKVNMKN